MVVVTAYITRSFDVDAEFHTFQSLKILHFALVAKRIYSQLSLSRLRLSRINAYLEEKIMSLF